MNDTTATDPSPTLESAETLPLVPLLVAVWSDGVLSDDEVRGLGERLRSDEWLTERARAALEPWLDPDRPPPAETVARLRRRVRALDPDGGSATDTLVDLGLALWEHATEGTAPDAASGRGATTLSGPWSDEAAVAWLRDIESSLGLLGSEVARGQVGVQVESPSARPRHAGIDPTRLRAFLDRDQKARRDQVLGLLTRPELRIGDTTTHDAYRERVLEAVRFLADEGIGRLAYPKAVGGADDPGGAIAAFETLAFGDLSVLVKFGVQFGLFGGSVHQLGTERHHARYLVRIGSLALPGCYAMTETGHGSNVRDLETTARFDPGARELVITSPTEASGKDWIGNAAVHGRLATVFARLVVDDQDHGVHAVLVPIRGEDGEPLAGVRIEDRGAKIGLNGVDNGRLWFDDVRVPVDNLLDRFGGIDAEGRYRSPIPSPGRRFFTMLRTLVAGRVSVAAASVSAAKVGLTIAVRHASRRRQFGPEGGPERPILDYLAMRRRLAPRLATTLALHFAVRRLQRRFVEDAKAHDAEVEVRAAALKAYASDHCVETLQACREACGGQGYLAENRFAALKADTDVFTTFEGANDVLLQLVAKGLLSRYRDEVGEPGIWRAVKYLGERAETSLTELNPLVTRRTDEGHLLDPAFHRAAFEYREGRLLRSAAARLRARLRDGMDSSEAVNQVQDHLLALARAHAESLALTAFQEAIATAPSPGMSEMLADVCALYALWRIEVDRGWYLESGYIEPAKSRAIRERVTALSHDVIECADALVSAFGIPEEILPPIGRRAES